VTELPAPRPKIGEHNQRERKTLTRICERSIWTLMGFCGAVGL
jgi:hypothetical protein